MHARGEIVVFEEVECHQTTNLPGFKIRPGSNEFLSRCISSSVGGGLPQASTSRRRSFGAAKSTSDPPLDSAAARASRTPPAPPTIDQWTMPTPGDAHH